MNKIYAVDFDGTLNTAEYPNYTLDMQGGKSIAGSSHILQGEWIGV